MPRRGTIIRKFIMKDILVIGESCRDIYVYCDTNRLSPDIPVPVLTEKYRIENGGMAKNTQRNIRCLVKNCDILTNAHWESLTKTRYVHDESNHAFFRVDSARSVDKINIAEIDYNYKIIVVSDYDKGFLSEEDIRFICASHSCVFLDTKKILGEWCMDAAYIKINSQEYLRSQAYIESYPTVATKIIKTARNHGCFYDGDHYPVKQVEVKDVSGAGDSFMAALVVEYFKSEDIKKSIKFANACASEVVKHRGVSLIS